ncbi:MAG: adenylate/guanylate cyclase domain-containing protein [Sulfuricurvum sp.]|uniref:adenylate/guanylate cyclase domain-containing protein n=1 Tax=Sulfuricurvum sp. TaxID=2025608 RepID=UPI00260D77CF|nr:adenylate/guanylate cyclase domain-containing protein [Sulfuricurvum sp.]MDD2830151.1 adenylate/guanylate cyclase domain-containing protein [Sulfuricurvum sp.]MDD4950349.1 adenylate/guanylate cyclase domain-containing protein [Sulfuricurvum sp.]
MNRRIRYVIKKGGLKLKLIGFTSLLIIFTITILSTFIIQITQSSIEKKAFEVATTSLKQIADFSTHALLERSKENEINLAEMVKDVQNSHIEGLMDVSIYVRKKTANGSIYQYFAGFSKIPQKDFTELNLIQNFSEYSNDKIFIDETSEFYRFIHPVIYNFQGKPIVLGLAVLKYDKETINKVLREVIHLSVYIAIIIIVFTVLLIYFAGMHFTRPILRIADAATDVMNGNLNVKLSIKTNDEIEELATRFNRMVRGLRERDKMEKFVSDSTMCMIQEDSDKHSILGGEYRNMTFFFSDIRGFTAMSIDKKPDEVVTIVNYYLDLQSQIIKRFGGDIDKFVGDEIMASFSGDDGVDHAIECAIAIQTAIADANELRKAENHTICNVGIGINYGEVIVGNIGSHDRMDFTSIGSEVNLAARLCSLAEAGQILIEVQTCILATLPCVFKPAYEINVKGLKRPVSVVAITMEGLCV